MFTYTVKEINEYTREISGEINQEAVDKEYNKVLRELKREVMMPGFRKGKIPLSILKKRFSDEIKKQVTEDIFREYYPKILDDANLHPVTPPDIDELQVEEGKPLTFKFSAEVIGMEVPHDYLGVEIDVEKTEVKDEEIDTYLNSMRYRGGQLQVVEGRPVKAEDILNISVEAKDGEELIEELGREQIQINIGKNMYIDYPDFDKQLIDMNVAEEKTFSLTFPEDFSEENVAGKEISFTVKVQDIKEVVLPELNDEFAKTLGDYTSLEDLKESIKTSILSQKEMQVKDAAVKELITKIIEKNPITVPPSMLQDYIDDFAKRYQSQTDEALTPEQKREKFEEGALYEIKKTYLLMGISKKENIVVTDSEVEEAYKDYMNFYGSIMRTNPNPDETKESLRHNLQESKSIAFLYTNAKKNGLDEGEQENGAEEKEKTESDASTTEPEKE